MTEDTTTRPVRKQSAPLPLVLTGELLLGLALIGGCQIQFGGGGNYGNVDLEVPYYAQPELLLCAPTSVLMWRRNDGGSYIAPPTLGDLMGCAWQTSGCTIEQTVQGVRSYTSSGADAFLDDWGGVVGDPNQLAAQYFSRQITSLVNDVPVVGLIYGATHAVVVHAGNYTTASNGLRQWDYVYVHDPLWGSGYRRFVAGEWMDASVFQVISSSAIEGWQENLNAYGGGTQVRGWAEWEPENQY